MLRPLPLSKARLEALTDGIFAVTMTLLVLDLKFADRVSGDPSKVMQDLLALLPYIDDYVISFVVLCTFWIAHMRVIRRVSEVDGTFVWLNLTFLLFTTFVPPLTSWIGHSPEQPVAAIVYGSNLALIIGIEALMWRRACLHLWTEAEVDGAALWRVVRRRVAASLCIIAMGMIAALLEIRHAENVNFASYVYLLLIGASFVRRHMDARPKSEPG
ncbi:MAG: TMEM175 family protein [Burkholderiales bacterium]